ncbi:NAD-dependent epimerase/dehydratase family protein [Candidatus Pelagibacter sp.]|uniref:NAD-dependent epimerase/dehydratase family protein n=1 Tax=Candidatus Pelagibacter sp. TaxID=2024849 RepID=UPI003F858487
MSKNILVTGGAGYIGSMLVPELLKAGHNVTVIDNFMFGQSSLNNCCSYPNFKIVNCDIRHQKLVAPFYESSEVIIPLAGYVGAPLCKKDMTGAQTVNHDAIIYMLDTLRDDQVVLMPTTNSAYGSGNKDNFCDENSVLNPISKYALDKVAVEKKLMERKNSISFRLATVFGMSPKMRIDLLVNDFVYRATKDGFVVLYESHFKRNYIHVQDVVSVFIHALNNFEKMRGEIFNVGLSDANLSKLELCERIKLQVKNFIIMDAPMAKDPDQRNYIVSNKKIESTGWKPNKSLDDGIFELIKGYEMLVNSKYGNV